MFKHFFIVQSHIVDAAIYKFIKPLRDCFFAFLRENNTKKLIITNTHNSKQSLPLC